jgi:hypothetical protein
VIRLLLRFAIRVLWTIDDRRNRSARVENPEDRDRKMALMMSGRRQNSRPRVDIHFVKTIARAQPISRPRGMPYKSLDVVDSNPAACPTVYVAD